MTLDELCANPDHGHHWLTASCGIDPNEATRLIGILADEHALSTQDGEAA